MNLKLRKLSIVIGLSLFSGVANAEYTATAFSGPALKPFTDLTKVFSEETAKSVAAIQDSTLKMTNSTGAAMAQTQKAIYASSMKAASDEAAIAITQTQLQMDLEAEIAAKQQMAKVAPIDSTDTLAEMKFLMEFLRKEDIKQQNIYDVIQFAKDNLDGKAVVVDPPVLAGPNFPEGKGVERTIYPSVKLLVWAQRCSDSIRPAVDAYEATKATNTTSIETSKTMNSVVESTDAGEISKLRNRNQTKLSCTPEQMQGGMCATDLTQDEYLNKVVANEIIPNGNISASNFYSPMSFGGAAYLSGDPAAAELMDAAASNALEPVTSGGTKGTAPIFYTYRNSNQLRAARDFGENVVNPFSVANQDKNERTSEKSAEFQSRFISRQASLSLAQSAFDASLARRRGEALSNISTSYGGPTVKEREDGAGTLDKYRFKVQESLDRFSAENAEKYATTSETSIILDMYKDTTLENELLLEELLSVEKQEVLMATLVANEVNSPENIKYLKSKGE